MLLDVVREGVTQSIGKCPIHGSSLEDRSEYKWRRGKGSKLPKRLESSGADDTPGRFFLKRAEDIERGEDIALKGTKKCVPIGKQPGSETDSHRLPNAK